MAATLKRWLPHVAWPPDFDPEVLDELTLGDERMRDDVVTRYLRALKRDLDDLHSRARRTATSPLVRRRAHQIAGASRMVGAHAVAERAARLEQAGEPQLRAPHRRAARDLFHGVTAGHRRVRATRAPVSHLGGVRVR